MVCSLVPWVPFVALLALNGGSFALAHWVPDPSHRLALRSTTSGLPVSIPLAAPSSAVAVARDLLSLSIEGEASTTEALYLLLRSFVNAT